MSTGETPNQGLAFDSDEDDSLDDLEAQTSTNVNSSLLDGFSPQVCLLQHVIARLKEVGLLTDDLMLPSNKQHHGHQNIFEGHDNEVYMGICRLRPELPRRRIDIKVYHVSEISFAVLYFTGSKDFNRQLRLYANKRFSLSLSDHALTPYRETGKKMNNGLREKIATGAGNDTLHETNHQL